MWAAAHVFHRVGADTVVVVIRMPTPQSENQRTQKTTDGNEDDDGAQDPSEKIQRTLLILREHQHRIARGQSHEKQRNFSRGHMTVTAIHGTAHHTHHIHRYLLARLSGGPACRTGRPACRQAGLAYDTI